MMSMIRRIFYKLNFQQPPFVKNQSVFGRRKISFALAVLCGLLIISASGGAFISIIGNPSENGNLDRIKKITRAVYLIQQNYYDPRRINPEKMLREGLYALSKKIP